MGGSGVLRNWKLPFLVLYLGALFVYDIQTTELVRSVLYTHSSVYVLAKERDWMATAAQVFFILVFFMMNEYFSTLKFERAAILLIFQNGQESDGVGVWVCVFPGTLEHLVWRFKYLSSSVFFLSCNSTS